MRTHPPTLLSSVDSDTLHDPVTCHGSASRALQLPDIAARSERPTELIFYFCAVDFALRK
jgi:hypothetical protein